MSPQRQLGGAQSLAGKPKRFNAFGYFWIMLRGTAFRLLTHQLALVARSYAFRYRRANPFSSTTFKTNRIHEPSSVTGLAVNLFVMKY